MINRIIYMISTSFRMLIDSTSQHNSSVHVWCTNGVGSVPLQVLAAPIACYIDIRVTSDVASVKAFHNRATRAS